MVLDDSDLIFSELYYKDLRYRTDGDENVVYDVFVDWGVSQCEDYQIVGSPFQIRSDAFTAKGANVPDTQVLYRRRRIDTSLPQFGQVELDTPVGPVHFKPGINI